MHDMPLHRRVSAECLCCRVETEFVFTSRSDQVICKGCLRHQGDTALKAILRDRDHLALWQSELTIAKDGHASVEADRRHLIEERDHELAKRQAEINDLRQVVRVGVENAPLAAVEQWWADEQIRVAHDQRDAAYRSRDHAYRALWAADRLHHEDEQRDRYCICGRQINQCKELQAVESAADSLLHWERGQIDRFQQGLSHGLPDEHPEVLRSGQNHHRRRGHWAG